MDSKHHKCCVNHVSLSALPDVDARAALLCMLGCAGRRAEVMAFAQEVALKAGVPDFRPTYGWCCSFLSPFSPPAPLPPTTPCPPKHCSPDACVLSLISVCVCVCVQVCTVLEAARVG